jgi:glycosyltransferase involved in cell wall biosynthesis
VSYAIVSPVKDEAGRLGATAESIALQTLRPARWVIVDDGSTDGTGDLARRLAGTHDWISAIDSGADGDRARGGRVVRAFDSGRAALQSEHDFVVKLDGDITLPSDYFERIAETFQADPRAGIVGGRVLVHDGRRWVPERVGRHTVHGAIKSYRSECLTDIGGLHPSMGWDGIDEYAAKARGWKVIPLDGLLVHHHRQRGSKQRWWQARIEEGRGAHYMGYRPSFVVVRAGYRMLVEKPPVLGGAALFAGWLHAAVTRASIVDDPQAVAALRAEQGQRLRGRRAQPQTASPPAAR